MIIIDKDRAEQMRREKLARALAQPVVKCYSKLKIYELLSSQGLWEQFKQALADKGVWDAYDQALQLATDHPLFDGMLAYFTAQFPGLDVDEVLQYAEMDRI